MAFGTTRYLSIAVVSDFVCGIVIFAEFFCGITVFRTPQCPTLLANVAFESLRLHILGKIADE